MTYSPPTKEDQSRIRELIGSCALTSIETHECSAFRHEALDEKIEEDKANVEIGVQFRQGENSFGIRLVCEASLRRGSAKIAISGEFSVAEGHSPTIRDIQLFGNEVAVMTIFPYLREAVSDITSKVFGKPLLLPIVERGTITFDLE